MRAGNYQKLFPRRRDEQGNLVCRWHGCSKVLEGKRASFCSDACRDKALILCWPTEQRRQTLRRDNGICASCGLDCIEAWRIIRKHEGYVIKHRTWSDRGPYQAGSIESAEIFLGLRFGNKQTFWEANHIVAVAEGGTSALDNLETLCLLCHRAHTKALAGRMAKAKRAQLELAI